MSWDRSGPFHKTERKRKWKWRILFEWVWKFVISGALKEKPSLPNWDFSRSTEFERRRWCRSLSTFWRSNPLAPPCRDGHLPSGAAVIESVAVAKTSATIDFEQMKRRWDAWQIPLSYSCLSVRTMSIVNIEFQSKGFIKKKFVISSCTLQFGNNERKITKNMKLYVPLFSECWPLLEDGVLLFFWFPDESFVVGIVNA